MPPFRGFLLVSYHSSYVHEKSGQPPAIRLFFFFFKTNKKSLDYSFKHMHACCFISGLMAGCPWDSRVTGTNTRRVCRRIQASARLTLVAVHRSRCQTDQLGKCDASYP